MWQIRHYLKKLKNLQDNFLITSSKLEFMLGSWFNKKNKNYFNACCHVCSTAQVTVARQPPDTPLWFFTQWRSLVCGPKRPSLPHPESAPRDGDSVSRARPLPWLGWVASNQRLRILQSLHRKLWLAASSKPQCTRSERDSLPATLTRGAQIEVSKSLK